MNRKLHCIALRSVRHTDRKGFLAAWSSELGLVSLYQGFGSGREDMRRRGITMPLMFFFGDAEVKPGKEVISLRDITPDYDLQVTGAANPQRTAMAGLIGELLVRCLAEQQPDEAMDRFLRCSLGHFHQLSGVALDNFLIYFLTGLGRLSGVAPEMQRGDERRLFDLREGLWRDSTPLHGRFLEWPYTRGLRIALNMRPGNLDRWNFSSSERVSLVDGILSYLGEHLSLPSLGEISRRYSLYFG